MEEMALSSCASGRPLAELSSLAGTGNTAQLQGEPLSGEPSFPSVSNSQWHLFRAALLMPRARREGKAVFFGERAGLNRSHVWVEAATRLMFYGGVIKLSYADFIELLRRLM